MSDKLSQEQIDALLNQMSEGKVVDETTEIGEYGKFHPYDFHKPEKFGPEHLESLKTLSSAFAKKTIEYVSQRIRLPIHTEAMLADQVSFASEYVDTMPNDSYLFCIIDLGDPELGQVIVEYDLAFLIYIHECLTGGSAKRKFSERRLLSSFEELALKSLVDLSCQALQESFKSIHPIEPQLVAVETNPALLRVTSSNDMMALINIDVKSDYWISTIRVGVPFFSVEYIMEKLENVVEYTFDKSRNFDEEVEQEIHQVEKDAIIKVGDIKMTLAELDELEVGDCLLTETHVNQPLKGYLSNKWKFESYMGKSGTQKAIKFLRHTEKAQQER
ncbi:Flagellar motor switch protein FliM [Listeria grayi]|uniref:flagellar motor switch protein FliM n=1 Tax=Listeria grayi TaxID=1641 RepID=UPI000F6F7A79|nr:flagellar motor switch protein FliM [Listeria grayi]MBC1921257.1 flagellar motor switch protein FliM [Listeria grayi]VEI35467.1 Flagellar motor switch protein FliM [Listeria grayi]